MSYESLITQITLEKKKKSHVDCIYVGTVYAAFTNGGHS